MSDRLGSSAHHNATTWFCDPDHLPGYVEGPGRKHGAEYERVRSNEWSLTPQVARVSFLELQPAEIRRHSSSIAGVDEIPGNVDFQQPQPRQGQGNRRRAISAAQIEDAQRCRYPERLNTASPD